MTTDPTPTRPRGFEDYHEYDKAHPPTTNAMSVERTGPTLRDAIADALSGWVIAEQDCRVSEDALDRGIERLSNAVVTAGVSEEEVEAAARAIHENHRASGLPCLTCFKDARAALLAAVSVRAASTENQETKP